MTVGEFKEHLKVFGDDWEIEFSGLTFFRTKARGEKLVNVEFENNFQLQYQTGSNVPDLAWVVKPEKDR